MARNRNIAVTVGGLVWFPQIKYETRDNAVERWPNFWDLANVPGPGGWFVETGRVGYEILDPYKISTHFSLSAYTPRVSANSGKLVPSVASHDVHKAYYGCLFDDAVEAIDHRLLPPRYYLWSGHSGVEAATAVEEPVKLPKHDKATRMAAAKRMAELWRESGNEPMDGVDYQNRMRAEWR